MSTATGDAYYAQFARKAKYAKPRGPSVVAPHWKAVLRWSLQWPAYEDDPWRIERADVVGRWKVRVA